VLSAASNHVTQFLARWSDGDLNAREALIPLVYDELRRIARSALSRQRPGHTLESTALVHEAYMRLVGRTSVRFESRTHFFAVASHLMRRILVHHARKHNAAKRGGANVTLVLDDSVDVPDKREIDLSALDEALNALAKLDGRVFQRSCGIALCVANDCAAGRIWSVRSDARQPQSERIGEAHVSVIAADVSPITGND
jgi:RNA polymerase sigma factor (TIGR02999 family)